MQLVDNNTFLRQLTSLFEATKDKGTVWLTHKRLTHDGDDAAMSDASTQYPCLIRLTNGKQTNFSTHVQPSDLLKFHAAYGALLKSSLGTLRKRDKKLQKLRAEAVAKRKARLASPVVVTGPKRGNGRRKRQRLAKAAMKQEETRERAAKREEGKV
ncbi:hypothetical protein HYDPIDRAFT_42619 [Hydnomerulius pinastri MD-312]|uniref:Signal recognition particle subunit SRP14 n=1 Tax=Hydnomerulius pinastri MD-312 TaxID=994086 RepID=A0A0C9WC55_9AGAM|nr:hypothetical protein HYDPIDRAFT_42619 [Hydnomerulius pinastri MD-312]